MVYGRPVAVWRVIIAAEMIDGTDDDLSFGDWSTTTPERMKNWTERKLLECQRISHNELFSSWVQAELTRRRNLELKRQIQSLTQATSGVHEAVSVLARSSDRLEGLTVRLIRLTWILIFLAIAAIAVPAGIEIWKARREAPASLARPAQEQPKGQP
jgi:hypothetical protein